MKHQHTNIFEHVEYLYQHNVENLHFHENARKWEIINTHNSNGTRDVLLEDFLGYFTSSVHFMDFYLFLANF